jgi:hypothetical protein
MRCGLVAVLALLTFVPCAHAAPKYINVGTTRLGDWRLDVARDGFSGAIACRLEMHHHRALVRAGAVGFRFPRHWDLTNAVYRLDDGAPRRSRDDIPRLLALGVPFDRGPIDNAADGWIWIPLAALDDVRTIVFEPRPGHSLTTVTLHGLSALYDQAQARGCTPDGRFVGP